MDALDLARWQFGITTVYHFFFVPITIGLSALVAGLQTAWVRTGRVEYLRATKFWGKLFLINFAMGVVTGIVQEFQFGMNWSAYSRFVGDIFGAPLAIEGLLAFFLESTFLGLWIFGWDRLPKRIHLATIWIAAIGTLLSAYFILAANSWMQHPVGFSYNPATQRAELHDFLAVLTNSTTLVTFPHTITAAFLTAGVFMAAVSAWHLRRQAVAQPANEPGGNERDLAERRGDEPVGNGPGGNAAVFRASFRLALWTILISGALVMVTGDLQARIMTSQQPMKMAAAEALYDTSQPASLSLFTVGSLDGREELYSVRLPWVLSFMATGDPGGEVEGINDLQAEYEQKYGPGNYVPYVPVAYWSFRFMIGLGGIAVLLGLVGLWFTRRGRLPAGRLGRLFWTLTVWAVALPLAANSFGWIFTEMGRQPWTVFGVLQTPASVSPGVGAGTVATSLAVFTLLYGALAVVELWLMIRYAKAGPPQVDAASEADGDADRPLAFAY